MYVLASKCTNNKISIHFEITLINKLNMYVHIRIYVHTVIHVCEIDMNAVQCVHVYLLPLVYCIHIRT